MKAINYDTDRNVVTFKLSEEEFRDVNKWQEEVSLCASYAIDGIGLKNFHEAVKRGKRDIELPSEKCILKNAWCTCSRKEGDAYFADYTFDEIEKKEE